MCIYVYEQVHINLYVPNWNGSTVIANKMKAKWSFWKASSLFIYILISYLHKFTYFFSVYYCKWFYSSILSDATVTPSLKACASDMVLLLITSNQKVWFWSGIRWCKFYNRFCENQIVQSSNEGKHKTHKHAHARVHTHTHTPPPPWWCHMPTFLQ